PLVVSAAPGYGESYTLLRTNSVACCRADARSSERSLRCRLVCGSLTIFSVSENLLRHYSHRQLRNARNDGTEQATEESLSARGRHLDNVVRHPHDAFALVPIDRIQVDDHLLLLHGAGSLANNVDLTSFAVRHHASSHCDCARHGNRLVKC